MYCVRYIAQLSRNRHVRVGITRITVSCHACGPGFDTRLRPVFCGPVYRLSPCLVMFLLPTLLTLVHVTSSDPLNATVVRTAFKSLVGLLRPLICPRVNYKLYESIVMK